MDDPWGSPWAAADGDGAHKKSRSRSRSRAHSPAELDLDRGHGLNLDLAPPKPAFHPAGSLAQSPWADDHRGDDDGFGDWASAPPEEAAANDIWGGWAGDDGLSAKQRLTPTPRDEETGEDGSPAWPSSMVAFPGAAFKPLSRKPSSLSRVSDDPWAAEPSLNDLPPLDHTTQPSLTMGTHANDLQDINENNEGVGLGLVNTLDPPNEGNGPQEELVQPIHVVSRPSSRNSAAAAAPTIHIQTEEEQKASIESHSAAEHDPAASDAASAASRPSSRGSDGSHRDHDERQDSPITSVDEDGRNRPQLVRKGSSKVQDLVVMFDGMAQRDVTQEPEPEPATPDKRPSRAGDPGNNAEEEAGVKEGENSEEDDDADFGDFEDPLSRRPSKQPSGVPSPERLPTPEPPPVADTPASPQTRQEPTSSRPGTSGSHVGPPLVDQLVAKYGPIKFDLNPAGVDSLFDVEKLASVRPPSTADASTDVSDHIITDSFATISERKTWYRVSRQGSARRHDGGGDDESYRRVAWPTSEVHAETIRIVRRWMEEDSIGGRPILGGAGSKENAFGWDSTAEPVTLEQVFGKRREAAAAHARQSSLQSLGSVPSPLVSPARKRWSLRDQSPRQAQAASPKTATRGPAAQFGWSSAAGEMTGPPARPATPPGVPHPPASQPGINRPAVPSAISTERIQAPPAGPTKGAAGLAPPPIITGRPPEASVAADDDDDDEWGEMVMSPPGDEKPGDAFSSTSPSVAAVTGASSLGRLDDLFGPPGPQQAMVVEMPLPPTSLAGLVSPVTSLGGLASPTTSLAGFTSPTTVPSLSSFLGHDTKASALTASADPWDLSFFDAAAPPSAPPPKTAAIPPMAAGTRTSLSQPSRPALAMAPPSVPAPASAQKGTSPGAEPTAEQTRLAQNIISGLPDLSYMLR